ncbi:Cytochrome [Forsythia ovata]|uniref:Cytochrome n=1 Tax=Forsythia ovata TaxID=205694 RepID=A0ABD1S021_9LAMI
MDKFLKTVLFSCLLISVFGYSSYAQNCSEYKFSNNNNYTTCNSLPVLNSFLHWNYHQSNNSVDIAYRHTGVTSSDWVVWSLNPTRQGMDGAQCLVAFQNSSGIVSVYTSPVSGYYHSTARRAIEF